MNWRVTCLCAHWIGYASTREIAVSLCEQHQKEQPERAGHITALTDMSGQSGVSTPARSTWQPLHD
jgi:hypothetical protein